MSQRGSGAVEEKPRLPVTPGRGRCAEVLSGHGVMPSPGSIWPDRSATPTCRFKPPTRIRTPSPLARQTPIAGAASLLWRSVGGRGQRGERRRGLLRLTAGGWVARPSGSGSRCGTATVSGHEPWQAIPSPPRAPPRGCPVATMFDCGVAAGRFHCCSRGRARQCHAPIPSAATAAWFLPAGLVDVTPAGTAAGIDWLCFGCPSL